METGSTFDISTLFNWAAGALSALVMVFTVWRIFKVYFGASASDGANGQVKAEEKGKKYVSQIADGAVAIVLIVCARALLGFLTGWFQDGLGTFM